MKRALAALPGVELLNCIKGYFLSEIMYGQDRQANDSRECRNCHNYDCMDYSEQGRRAVAQRNKGFAENKTCIDCHKGVAHTSPPIEQHIGARRESRRRSSEGDHQNAVIALEPRPPSGGETTLDHCGNADADEDCRLPSFCRSFAKGHCPRGRRLRRA